MVQFERKLIKNKPFFYLIEQVNIGIKYKKIQVYLGKNIPNDLRAAYGKLEGKERELIKSNLRRLYALAGTLSISEYEKMEFWRLRFKYHFLGLTEAAQARYWRGFAIRFIFESNAIEGSRLSQSEVEAIIRKRYVKSKLARKEIAEVENSIRALDLVRSGKFRLNQRGIIGLHEVLMAGLDVETGYKKKAIVVNNKATTAPGKIRPEMAGLIGWYKKEKKARHPFLMAVDFHRRFEAIHPFRDGNGRSGRLLLNWMLVGSGYGPILLRNSNRQAYFSALDQADGGRPGKLYRHCLKAYESTIRDAVS